MERAAAAHDRMTALVLRGGGVEDVAAAVTEVLGGALLVLDADGRRLAAGRARSTRAGPAGARRGGGRLPDRGAQRAPRRPLWYAAVVAGTENLGALVLRPDDELVDADQRILERAALVTALLLLFRRTVAEAEGRVRGELLDDLIARPVRDADALRARARRLGVDLDRPHVLVAVADDASPPPARPGSGLLSWATHLRLDPGRAGRRRATAGSC